MEDSNLFDVKIITPERLFYEGKASMLEFNTTEGEIGVLKNHIPMTVIIEPGILTITEEEHPKNAALHAGFAVSNPDSVIILAEIIEWPSEIDENRAQEAFKRAQERLAAKDPDTDLDRAAVALKKAICRINSVKK